MPPTRIGKFVLVSEDGGSCSVVAEMASGPVVITDLEQDLNDARISFKVTAEKADAEEKALKHREYQASQGQRGWLLLVSTVKDPDGRPGDADRQPLLEGPLAKPTSRFVCQSCGAVSPKWAGRCEACGEWNTIVEEAITPRPGPAAKGGAARRVAFVDLAGSAEPPPRCPTGIAELDRVLGGGLVPASAILVGGDPGIGKSTLLLQAAAGLARAGRRVLYISGEESIEQTRLRARRLGVADAPLELAAAINLRDIAASLQAAGDAALVVIDSIQTMWLDSIDSAPGTVAQVRASSFELIQLAKAGKFALVLVGHVTKDGAIAGSARAGAHGRRGAVFRRRPRPPVPHPARGEEPLRRHRRDRRVRDDRPRPGRGRQPLGAVPGRAAGERRRQRGVRRAGRDPAGAGGGAGAAVAQSRRHAATLRDRLGRRAAADAARGAGGARRAAAERDGRVPEHRRRPARQRAGRRPGGGGGAGVGRDRHADQCRDGVFRRDRPVGRGPPGRAGRCAAEGGGQARVRAGHAAAPGGARQPPAGARGWAGTGGDRPHLRSYCAICQEFDVAPHDLALASRHVAFDKAAAWLFVAV